MDSDMKACKLPMEEHISEKKIFQQIKKMKWDSIIQHQHVNLKFILSVQFLSGFKYEA